MRVNSLTTEQFQPTQTTMSLKEYTLPFQKILPFLMTLFAGFEFVFGPILEIVEGLGFQRAGLLIDVVVVIMFHPLVNCISVTCMNYVTLALQIFIVYNLHLVCFEKPALQG